MPSNNGRFSLVAPAPPGFLYTQPGRAQLLRSVVAIFAPTFADAAALLPNFSEAVHGVVITPSPTLRLHNVNDHLVHLEAPTAEFDSLANFCDTLISHIDRGYRSEDGRQHGLRQIDRLAAQVETLRLAHNDVANQLADRISDLKHEIEQREQAEASLRHADKMRAIGEIAGGVAHDFNNMLGAIISATELMIRRSENAQPERLHTIILGSAERAADLTSKLLAFGRRATLRAEPLNLHHVARDALAMLETSMRKRISICTHFAAEQAMVRGDITQLQNAILNIGLNAVDAMPSGGTFTIRTQATTMPGSDQTKAIEIALTDSGNGVAEEHLPRIFEPFFTTKSVGEGTGLGLAAVYGTIQEHDGAIGVDSTPGHGTTIYIKLPVIDDHAKNDAPTTALPKSAGGLILIVDDERALREAFAEQLELLGYEAVTAVDGRDGLQAFHQWHDQLAGVMIDVVMPELDGRGAFEAMQRINPTVPIVAMSGYDRDAGIAEMEQAGLAGFLRKPFRIAELNATIEGVFQATTKATPT